MDGHVEFFRQIAFTYSREAKVDHSDAVYAFSVDAKPYDFTGLSAGSPSSLHLVEMKSSQYIATFEMRFRICLAVLMVAGESAITNAANVYQCKDANGKVTITDKPCSDNQKTEKTSEFETAADRAQAHDTRQNAKGNPMPGAMRSVQCPMFKDLYNGLDKRLLEANRRNDDQAKKKIIEDRRWYGAKINELGC